MAQQLGLGVMIQMLAGGSEHGTDEYIGKVITEAVIDDNRLKLTFKDGKKIAIFDNGQSCCESRYMTCDDDIKSLVGKKLKDIKLKSGPEVEDDYGCHEQQFLEVQTNKGFITIANHNKHNGYYGGFALEITELT